MMFRFLRSRPALAWLLVSVGSISFTACDLLGPSPRLTLSITSKPATPAASLPSRSAQDVIVGTGANSVQITKVEFVLAHLELSPAGTCSIPPTNDDNCDELELAPLLVDLPLDGSIKAVLDNAVPAGSYTRLQAELHAVKTGEDDEQAAATAFLTAHPDWPTGVSVRVTGVYTDAAGVKHDFSFTSRVSAEIEMEFSTPVTVDASTHNLTISVDVASWFTDAAGAAIDPTNSANAELISANIKKSFHAFKDDDRDGEHDPD